MSSSSRKNYSQGKRTSVTDLLSELSGTTSPVSPVCTVISPTKGYPISPTVVSLPSPMSTITLESPLSPLFGLVQCPALSPGSPLTPFSSEFQEWYGLKTYKLYFFTIPNILLMTQVYES